MEARWRSVVAVLSVIALAVGGCGSIFITERPAANRYGTAARLAEEAFPDGADVALLATARGFADALAAAPLAAKNGAPILLTEPDGIPDATLDALDDLGVDDVVLLGGTTAISEDVVDELARQDVDRIAGDDRFETAAALAGDAFPDGAEVALLATGRGFADALAAAPLAVATGAPILLTGRDTVPLPTLRALDELGVERVVLLGGEAAVSSHVEDALAGGPLDVERHAGADRYATAARLAREAFPGGAQTALVATGAGFADALAAAPLAMTSDAPILLTDTDELPDATTEALDELGADRVIVIGGTAAVSEDVEETLSEGRDVERLAGGG